ncbi:MAG TPA: type I methionyl aminopeptidase [Candidatus Moranbacteria bacterium]|nr:type I methionyl aminopeptidase [Candidatus Moranbacteria bacterium]HRY28245.1 type I methionyl aminopeptidase [Candidatus Moranbacteria bacterium]HSA08334.1 type I methionyl aminopeptidase [Candidatus Moranbacteria bacterium]
MFVSIKTEKEIEKMRQAGQILKEIMQEIGKEVRPGVDTLQLDKLAEELVFARGGKPLFKGYGGGKNPFPGTICASINDEVVHGIPGTERVLNEGDILKIDIGIEVDGYCSDMARTFPIGKISAEAQKLMEITEKSFWKGVGKMKEGSMLSEYSKAVQKTAEDAGFSVVRNLVGHGIGQKLHEDPQILNYYERSFPDLRLQAGMTLALEPMINQGDFRTVIGKDGWVFKTADGSLSAHYENTILVTKKGIEVLTM